MTESDNSQSVTNRIFKNGKFQHTVTSGGQEIVASTIGVSRVTVVIGSLCSYEARTMNGLLIVQLWVHDERAYVQLEGCPSHLPMIQVLNA